MLIRDLLWAPSSGAVVAAAVVAWLAYRHANPKKNASPLRPRFILFGDSITVAAVVPRFPSFRPFLKFSHSPIAIQNHLAMLVQLFVFELLYPYHSRSILSQHNTNNMIRDKIKYFKQKDRLSPQRHSRHCISVKR